MPTPKKTLPHFNDQFETIAKIVTLLTPYVHFPHVAICMLRSACNILQLEPDPQDLDAGPPSPEP